MDVKFVTNCRASENRSSMERTSSTESVDDGWEALVDILATSLGSWGAGCALSPGDDTSDEFEEMLLRIRQNVWSDGVPIAIALLDD